MEIGVEVASREIRTFLLERFCAPQPEALAEDTSLLDTGIVNSAGIVEIIAFLEEQFGIKVEHEEILPENLDSVARLAGFVRRKLGATSGTQASGGA